VRSGVYLIEVQYTVAGDTREGSAHYGRQMRVHETQARTASQGGECRATGAAAPDWQDEKSPAAEGNLPGFGNLAASRPTSPLTGVVRFLVCWTANDAAEAAAPNSWLAPYGRISTTALGGGRVEVRESALLVRAKCSRGTKEMAITRQEAGRVF
jgi:hypothetical protein